MYDIKMDVKKKFPCQLCDKVFSQRQHVQKHILSVHSDDKNYKCIKCDKAFKLPQYLKRHQTIHSELRPYNCKYCTKSFSDPSALGRHHRVHESNNVKSFVCSICDKRYTTIVYLRAHVKRTHNEKKYKCDLCPREIKGKGPLKEHIKQHSASIQCYLCDKIFTTISQRNKHINGFHNKGDRISCTMCSSTFKNKEYRSKHMKYRHSKKDLGRWKCAICNKCFAQQGGLINHMKTHSGVKTNCPMCEFKMTYKYELKYHLSSVHNIGAVDKKHSCSICSKSYFRESRLKTHIMTHTGLKPYICEHCHVKMSKKRNLTTHLLRCKQNPNNHKTPAKQFYCQLCSYSSIYKSSILLHQKVHQEPSFQCDLCNHKEGNAHNLKAHKETVHFNLQTIK